ncbi:hypothetical protein BDR26DRAFT_851636 [Obelidium mucronatum]|nr:hypothetical protein BDR26DRAFT_851636 [Obelidium mucronatum]
MCGALPEHPVAPHLEDSLWNHIHDVHCHVIDTLETLPLLSSQQVASVWVMGTKPKDWEQVQRLGQGEHKEKVIQAFGIHPWFAHTISDPATSLSELKSLLANNLHSFVGEIGLDGVATHPGTSQKYDMPTQLSLFTQQWNIAAELKRPVSVHAVGCFGKLEGFFQVYLKDVPKDMSRKQRDKLMRDNDGGTVLQQQDGDVPRHPSLEKWPPAIMLHSYSGSTESIRNILRYPKSVSSRFYFSFSYFVNSRTPFDRMKEKIAAVPDDRILIESDLDDMKAVDNACILALDLVARAKGWSLEDAAVRTGANALRFLSRVGK